MATVGLKDLYYAKITESTAENATKTTYDVPKRMAKAISADLTVEVAEGTLHADDGVDAVEREFSGGELTLNINDLENYVIADILGQEAGDDGVVYANAGDNAPYVAVGFRAKKPGGKYKYIWLYKVKFAIPNENYQTKGDSIEFHTPEITGTILQRPDDGNWKADYVALPTDSVAAAWFTAVKEPNAA